MITNRNEQENRSNPLADFAKKQARKQGRKLARKALKKLAKVAIKAASKALLVALKSLAGTVISASLPVLGIIALIAIGLLLIYIIVTLLFTYDDSVLTGKEAEMREYIIEAAANTVNHKNSFEAQYPVPYELMVASLQILDSDKKLGYDKADVDKLAEALAPEFHYKDVELKKETKTRHCSTNSDGKKSCSWKTSSSTFNDQVIDFVVTWEKHIQYDYEVHWGPWESVSSNKKIRKQYTTVSISGEEIDYTKFDDALSIDPFNYSTQDKYTVEVLYGLISTIHYREWKEGSPINSGIDFGDNVNVLPGSSIPTEYFQYYLAAQKKYGVDWYVLAAIHYIETKFSTISPMLSSVGAEGHFQIMPCTLHGWQYPGCDSNSNGYVSIPESLKYKVSTIKKYGGLGIDANGDGLASPWDFEDAVMTAAYMLKRNGYTTEEPKKAIFSYNHADWYVEDVLKYAKQFKAEAVYLTDLDANSAGFISPTTGTISSGYGWRVLNGGKEFHQGVDIKNKKGTPIFAVANGKVKKMLNSCPKTGSIESDCGEGWGNYLWITHQVPSGTYEAVYAHLDTINGLGVGDTVYQGQVIGQMGTSGRSTGVHLHFEIHTPVRIRYTNVLNPALVVPLP